MHSALELQMNFDHFNTRPKDVRQGRKRAQEEMGETKSVDHLRFDK